jgi:uncharacterized paraquat-inducible protein A
MGQIRDAALPGGLVGLFHGIINAIEYQYLLFPSIMPIIAARMAEQNPNASAMLPAIMTFLGPVILLFVVIFSVVLGIVLAIAFVSLRKSIPGGSMIRKALVFSIILLAVQMITGLGSFSVESYAQTAISLDIISIIEFPVLGLLFVYLLGKKTKLA